MVCLLNIDSGKQVNWFSFCVSVSHNLSLTITSMEGIPPYCANADQGQGANYHPWNVPPGSYTIYITPTGQPTVVIPLQIHAPTTGMLFCVKTLLMMSRSTCL